MSPRKYPGQSNFTITRQANLLPEANLISHTVWLHIICFKHYTHIKLEFITFFQYFFSQKLKYFYISLFIFDGQIKLPETYQ